MRIQASHVSGYDRYPEILTTLKRLLADVALPRILVVGAAHGQECMAIVGHIPDAQVVGSEIDVPCWRTACAAHPHGRVVFVQPSELARMGDYDAILCHSVLCHHPENRDKDRNDLWSFSAFEQFLAELEPLLRVGGWISIFNAEYRFADTRLASGYRAEHLEVEQFVQLFDTADLRVSGTIIRPLWRRLQ